jgi:hypothetical protein
MATTTTTTTTPRIQPARYSSTCRRCGQLITPGDLISIAGRGQTFHASCTATPAPQPQAPTTTGAPSDAQLMTAALAATIRQTFTGLLAMDARLGDVEPVWSQDEDMLADGPDPDPLPPPVVVAPLPVTRKAQTARAPRKATRKATFTPAAMAQPLSADDLL